MSSASRSGTVSARGESGAGDRFARAGNTRGDLLKFGKGAQRGEIVVAGKVVHKAHRGPLPQARESGVTMAQQGFGGCQVVSDSRIAGQQRPQLQERGAQAGVVLGVDGDAGFVVERAPERLGAVGGGGQEAGRQQVFHGESYGRSAGGSVSSRHARNRMALKCKA